MVHCQLLETVAAASARVNVPVWAKSGMHLGFWNDITTSVYKDMNVRGEPYSYYVYGTFGATRIEENRVYNIVSFR